MTTTVVNIHKIKGIRPPFDVYCGRATKWTEFTEDSLWANRFTFEDWGEDALVKYEDEKRRQFKENPAYWEVELEKLRNKRIACWCVEKPISYIRHPMKCHCEIILKLLNERRPI